MNDSGIARVGLALDRLLKITGPNAPPRGLRDLSLVSGREHLQDVLEAAAQLQCLIVPAHMTPRGDPNRDAEVPTSPHRLKIAYIAIIQIFDRILARWGVMFREGQAIVIGEGGAKNPIRLAADWPSPSAYSGVDLRIEIGEPLDLTAKEHVDLTAALSDVAISLGYDPDASMPAAERAVDVGGEPATPSARQPPKQPPDPTCVAEYGPVKLFSDGTATVWGRPKTLTPKEYGDIEWLIGKRGFLTYAEMKARTTTLDRVRALRKQDPDWKAAIRYPPEGGRGPTGGRSYGIDSGASDPSPGPVE